MSIKTLQAIVDAAPAITARVTDALATETRYGNIEAALEELLAELVANGAKMAMTKPAPKGGKGRVWDNRSEEAKAFHAAFWAPVCDDGGAVLPKYLSDKGKRIGKAKTVENYYGMARKRIVGEIDRFRFTLERTRQDKPQARKARTGKASHCQATSLMLAALIARIEKVTSKTDSKIDEVSGTELKAYREVRDTLKQAAATLAAATPKAKTKVKTKTEQKQ